MRLVRWLSLNCEAKVRASIRQQEMGKREESERDFFLEWARKKRANGSERNFEQPMFDGYWENWLGYLRFILFWVVSVSLFSIISPHRLHEAQDADFSVIGAYVQMVTLLQSRWVELSIYLLWVKSNYKLLFTVHALRQQVVQCYTISKKLAKQEKRARFTYEWTRKYSGVASGSGGVTESRHIRLHFARTLATEQSRF